MRADLQTLADRFGATGWHIAPVDPNTPKYYVLNGDYAVFGVSAPNKFSPEQIAAALVNAGGGDSGMGLGDVVAVPWDMAPDGPIVLSDSVRGFIWHDSMSRFVTRAYEVRDEGMYDIAPNSRTFFDRLTYGLAVGMIASGAAAIGAGLAGVDLVALGSSAAGTSSEAIPAFVGPVENAGIMGPFVPGDFAATTAATVGTTAPSASGWTLAEVASTAKTVGQTAVTVAKTAGTVGSVVSAVSKLTPDQIRAVGSTAKLSGAAAADINSLSNNPAALAIAGGLLVLVLVS